MARTAPAPRHTAATHETEVPAMLDAPLRGLKDRTMGPLARMLGPRVHPHLVSVLSLAAGLGAAGAVAARLYAAAFGLWVLNRVLDGVDGALARAFDRQTDLGGYIDLMADFVVYGAIVVGLVLGRPPEPDLRLAALLMMTAFYLNAAAWMYLSAVLEKRRAGAETRGESTTITMPTGLVEGTETMVFYTLFLLLPGLLEPLFLIFAALVTLGMAQRVVWAVRSL